MNMRIRQEQVGRGKVHLRPMGARLLFLVRTGPFSLPRQPPSRGGVPACVRRSFACCLLLVLLCGWSVGLALALPPLRSGVVPASAKAELEPTAGFGRPAKLDPFPATMARLRAQQGPTGATSEAPNAASVVARGTDQQRIAPGRVAGFAATQHVSLWFLLAATLIATCLGALHALEPGPGNEVVAASLAGSAATARRAVLHGLMVTASHTAGILALGALALCASHFVLPERIYPWFGLLLGCFVAALGAFLLLRWLAGTTPHSHAPGNGAAGYLPWRNGRQHAAVSSSASTAGATALNPVGLLELLRRGTSGGLLPCPAAFAVLLSAVALHRFALGLLVLVAFTVGLAVVLIGSGLVGGRPEMPQPAEDGSPRRWLPALSPALITALGALVAMEGLAAAHLTGAGLTRANLGPVLFVSGLGLVLGMRHSTDADHVVAISTIVSRQRGILNAALIGSVWGLGHTITIFAVGALIILAGIKIPPRIGLAMEFSVALMLILLGCLNLTGVTARLIRRFSPSGAGIPAVADAAPERTVEERGAVRRGSLKDWVDRFGLFQLVRPLVIGLVHGLAGSAAVALLVLSTIHSPVWATVYLLIFGFGTVLGMMIMTSALAVPLTFAGGRFTQLSRYFGITSGLISVCFGLFLVYQLGYVGGLFTSHPQWTPQ